MKISYGDEFDERAIWEAEQRGWLNGIILEIDGKIYDVTVYSTERFILDLEEEVEEEECILVRPGSVVINGPVTVENAEAALKKLNEIGYFDLLLPRSIE